MLGTKNKRLTVCATTIAVVLGSILATAPAEAVPQWRLRRWLGRPAIDPTIRDTVRFGQNRSYKSTGSRRVTRGR